MKINHEKIFRRDNGSQTKVEIELVKIYSHPPKLRYIASVEIRSKGKRKWHYIPMQASGKVNKEIAAVISPKEILEAETEFWESIKPVMREMHEED